MSIDGWSAARQPCPVTGEQPRRRAPMAGRSPAGSDTRRKIALSVSRSAPTATTTPVPFSGTPTRGVLWRRTTIAMSRLLAARAGVPRTEIGDLVRLSFVKVAEFQTRGLAHLHVILRLDGPERSAPPAWATTELLADIVAAAALQTTLRTQRPDGTPLVVRWGTQLDVRPIRPNAEGECSDVRGAGYLAKYRS